MKVCSATQSRPAKHMLCTAQRQTASTPAPHRTSSSSMDANKRQALLLLSAPLLTAVLARRVEAGENNALAQFLRSRQAANGGETILAPVRGARLRLEDARALLAQGSAESYSEALRLVRAASFNCYVFDAEKDDSIETKASLLQQNLKFGDPCTYSIISRNVTNLLAPSQTQLKERTYNDLDSLVAAFRTLDTDFGNLRRAEVDSNSKQWQAVLASLDTAIDCTVAFEASIKECLGIA